MHDYDLNKHVCGSTKKAATAMKKNVSNAESCLAAVGNSARNVCSRLCINHLTWAIHQICMVHIKRVVVRKAFTCTPLKQTRRSVIPSCLTMVCNKWDGCIVSWKNTHSLHRCLYSCYWLVLSLYFTATGSIWTALSRMDLLALNVKIMQVVSPSFLTWMRRLCRTATRHFGFMRD